MAKSQELHIFFFPLMAPGHLIPMINLANLFALHGAKTTILTTPKCTSLIQNQINRFHLSGHSINLLVLSSSAKGNENLTSPELSTCFLKAMDDLHKPFDQALKEHQPNCVVTDMYLPWTQEIASQNSIPRLLFHTMGYFALSVIDTLDNHATNGCVNVDQDEMVMVHGLPHLLQMKKSQLHDTVFTRKKFSEFMESVTESELRSHGAIVNTFYELESQYADHYRKKIGRKAWHVGPLSLVNLPSPSQTNCHERIMTWLDSKQLKSVLYICFGSLSHPTKIQLEEIAHGLENANHHFIWVMRPTEEDVQEKEILTEQGKGLVIKGWAPQAEILSHSSIGGFMTHCGWNSVLESITRSVPILTWPMFAEQFYNEKLVVDVLGVGVKVGMQEWGMREEGKEVIGRDVVERGVRRVMDEGEEKQRLGERVNSMKEKARRAVEKGGSSCVEMERLMQEICAWRS
ncbi:Glycosyltransferase [Rhynchospora pubera]|uniref:Glycosyltransferase n=1 Tax=Rhynchospora pubera TaxID=906938 RepID=A0AAV8DYU4_9POAL|nr:Glycosyltransferase [Rhynchospora pubera]